MRNTLCKSCLWQRADRSGHPTDVGDIGRLRVEFVRLRCGARTLRLLVAVPLRLFVH